MIERSRRVETMTADERRPSPVGNGDRATRSPFLMLAVATAGFAINFWAWALISPLGPLSATSLIPLRSCARAMQTDMRRPSSATIQETP
jgi:hypothetical protein